MTDERELLQHVRDLIMQKQFSDARAILLGMPGSETARKWLAKLDEIDAPESPPAVTPDAPTDDLIDEPLPEPSAEDMIAPVSQRPVVRAPRAPRAHIGGIELGGGIRYAVSGVIIIAAVAMLIGFFAFSWMDADGLGLGSLTGDLAEDQDTTLTALEIWTGRNNGDNFTLDLDNTVDISADGASTSQEGGFANVRFLDRTLILIPLGAILLIWLAWMYGSEAMQPVHALIAMTVVALVLMAYPFAWQDWSKNDWEDDIESMLKPLFLGLDLSSDDFEFDSGSESGFASEFESDFSPDSELGLDLGLEALSGIGPKLIASALTGYASQAFSTGEQIGLGILAFLTCLLGLFAELLATPPRPTPRPRAF